VRAIAFSRVLALPPAKPVILTTWDSQDSAWGEENWDEVIALARRRPSPLAVVVLTCSAEENARRLQSSGRDAMRKPRDPALVQHNYNRRPLIDRGGDKTLHLDVTNLDAGAAATAIAQWLQK
jgi:hypothetical protein